MFYVWSTIRRGVFFSLHSVFGYSGPLLSSTYGYSKWNCSRREFNIYHSHATYFKDITQKPRGKNTAQKV